jgi:hypothetical protein
MAARGWATSTVIATGVAAGAGAAQFGLAYGLGIVGWQPVNGTTGEGPWLASLIWALWIAATSTLLGAIYASRMTARATIVSRVATPLAAAIGALITVPLVILPARAAQRADTFQPETTAAAYVVVGVVVGLVVAAVAVNVRVVAANIMASTAWVWLLAVISVVDSVRANRIAGTAQLAAWQFTDRGWIRDTLYLPGALLMLGSALLVGVLAALPADRRRDNRVCIAVSGTAGPLLVAAAYFLSAPRLTVRVEQLSSYLFAPYAVIAGLAGSVLVAVLGPLRPRRTPVTPEPVQATASVPAQATATVPAQATGARESTGETDLTEWTRTLGADPSEPATARGPGNPSAP